MSDVVATYRIATRLDLEKVAAVVAGEQSAGTFTRVAMESEELLADHGAVVESIEEGPAPDPASALPGAAGPTSEPLRVGTVRIRFPARNFGPSLAAVLTTVAGNLYELEELAGIKLLDVELPEAVVARYPGPRHGIAGTRQAVGNPDEVMLGTIVKPSIGLQPEQLASMVSQLADAGIDFVKDDEINTDGPYFPLAERIDTVQTVLDDVTQRTGKPVMYAYNVTGDLDHMKRAAEHVARRGGTCVMVAVPAIGLPALAELRRSTDLVIHGHRAGFGAMDRHPLLGYSFRAWQHLVRLAGADHLHVGGVNSKFWESNDQIIENVHALQEAPLRGEPILPVLSSAQTAATAEFTHRVLPSRDLLVLAGGGIHAHPGGIADGVAALREAWQHVFAGRSPQEEARPGSALAVALAHFGR